MRINRHFSSGLAFAVLALAAMGCASEEKTGGGKSKTDKDKEDGGGAPAATWTNQAYDVQSTWHDTNAKYNAGWQIMTLRLSDMQSQTSTEPATKPQYLDFYVGRSGQNMYPCICRLEIHDSSPGSAVAPPVPTLTELLAVVW